MELHNKFKIIIDIVESKQKLQNKLSKKEKVYYTKLSKVDTIIVTGGRNSFKTYSMSMILVILVAIYDFKILFTRYTMAATEDSIIPEITEKIELLNFSSYFKVYKKRIIKTLKNIKDEDDAENLPRLVFKGIKTSSGNQTANLKSLKGFNCFVLDEAEEHPDYKDWRKIYRSIRDLTLQNLSILILNPSNEEHWIYKKFFEAKGLTKGTNQVIDNICYIHMIYTDMLNFVPDNILREFEQAKKDDLEDFNHTILGGFLKNDKKLLFPKGKLKFYKGELKQKPIYKLCWIDTAGKGTDNFSMPVGYVFKDKQDYKIYITEVIYNKDDIDVTEPFAVEMINRNKLDIAGYETNQYGTMGYNSLSEKVRCNVYGKREHANKHGRIVAQSSFIRKYCVFRSDYKQNSEYALFMNDVYSYMKDGSSKDKLDAPDSLAGLMYLFRKEFNI